MSDPSVGATEAQSPVQHGFVAEAIAQHVLGTDAQWIGGRNPGYDFIVSGPPPGVKVDVKSGVRQQRIFRDGAGPIATIGIRLNKGLKGLQEQEVHDILIVVRDAHSAPLSRVSTEGTTAHVVMTVDVEGLAVYRLPVADVVRIFKRPFTRAGAPYVSENNVDATLDDLEPFRIPIP